MIMNNIKNWWLGLFVVITFTTMIGCTNQWDDHVKVETSTLGGTIMDAINSNTNLSTFAQMLKNTGYDKVLRSGSEFTVFAPCNTALSSYTSASDSIQKVIVKNQITFLKHNDSELSSLKTLRSVNGKNLTISELQFPSDNNTECLCSNGILRTITNVVMPKLNILEYLTNVVGKGKYDEVDWLLNATVYKADLDSSIETGVNSSGQPVYDTLYVAYNRFLSKAAFSNEDSTYTFALLPNSVFNTLKAKYAKYMKPAPDNETLSWGQTLSDSQGLVRQSAMADSIAKDELIKDLTFKTSNLTTGAQTDVDGVVVNVNSIGTANPLSNGSVQEVDDANITMKENKIKTIIIEAENYNNMYESNYVMTRIRSYASGGKDVILAGWNQQSRDSLNSAGTKVSTLYYNYVYNSSFYSTAIGSWIEYLTNLYTCNYNIYWKSYDDYSGHIHENSSTGSTLDPDYDSSDPTKMCASTSHTGMKLYVSFNGYPRLTRDNSTVIGMIKNNWADANIMTGNDKYYAFGDVHNAGLNEETQLKLYSLNVTYNASKKTYGTDPGSVNTTSGVASPLPVATYGQTRFWVTNSFYTSSQTSKYNGWIFLDYIKLVPQIDE
jgi:uncharacterized surface protein with fasciclin (FAS1) repeats